MEGASKYYSVVTDTGNKLMAAALAAGEKLTITEIAVGDGDGAYYQPDPEMTALKNELWRGSINSCEISSSSPNILIVRGDRKSTRLNSSHPPESRMPSSA